MWSFVYVTVFVCSLFFGQIALHQSKNGVLLQPLHASLALFLAIDVLICIWEIILFFYIGKIQDEFAGKKKKYEPGTVGRVFLFENASLSEVLSPSYWTQVWSTYALADRCYADIHSFGWNVDVGNGFSMLIPTVIFAVGMCLQEELMPARVLGVIGLPMFYQQLYGTLVYFMQYMINKRWQDHASSNLQIFLMVIVPNIIWVIFPSIGVYASVKLILADEATAYSIFNA